MRFIMMIASIAMVGSGIFCIANQSAAFLSVAFMIGFFFILMGLTEAVIGFRADFEMKGKAVNIIRDGVIMFILGIVIITGQITDDNVASTMFAMWMLIEGVMTFSLDQIDIVHISREERLSLGFSIIMILVGTYMFFNVAALDLYALLLIGISMLMLGLRRFAQSFVIEYDRPSFVTGNEEKLREAKEEEKRALAKAKEGIREQKNAQRRIEKIEADIAAERDVLLIAAQEREEREFERRLGE